MKRKYSFVCLEASIVEGGKLNATGILNRIVYDNFPATISKLSYVIDLKFSNSEIGEHKYKISIVDNENKIVKPSLHGRIEIKQDLAKIIIVNMDNTIFTKQGEYKISFYLDDKPVYSDLLNISLTN